MVSKAADASLPEGMFNLSSVLARGAEGVPKSEAKAKFYTPKAAEAGTSRRPSEDGHRRRERRADKPGTR
jgi:TPR repeat protein